MAEPVKRRRWLTFSLRTLLIVMTVTCVVFGLWINQLIGQRTAVRRFYELTANRPESEVGQLITMGYRYDGKDEYYKPMAYKWLHPLIGGEAFGEVTSVQLTDTATTDKDLRYLADVPTVERVWLRNTQVTDNGLAYLKACPNLRFLMLDDIPITDEGLARLLVLRDLDSISLNGTQITDAGLEHLGKLPKLKRLWLRNTAITDAGYQRLQQALPECEVQADVPSYTQKHQHLNW